jgi:hypothetical protein
LEDRGLKSGTGVLTPGENSSGFSSVNKRGQNSRLRGNAAVPYALCSLHFANFVTLQRGD